MKKLLLILLCFLLSGCANDSIKITANKNPGILHYVDFRSSVDKDHDGVDDATDIVKAVREYVATDPIYKSAYYAGGYPNDGHGVCTDVVAIGYREAGYDFMAITDHHLYSPSIEGKEIFEKLTDKFNVFRGEEVHNKHMGYFHIIHFDGD